MSKTMRAVRVHEWCRPSDLRIEEIERPEAGPGEVLIRVKSAALNFPDILKIEGKHHFKPERPFTPGTECSGSVEQVGSGVERFEPGQRVFARAVIGAFCEYFAIDQKLVHPIPESMSDDDAAVFSLVYHTSYASMVHRARLREGETVLVHSAAGGVGLAAVQIAKALGAGKIIATVGSDEKLAVVLENGADVAVNYNTEDFVEVVKRETGGIGADIIYDPVGGAITERSTKCIAPEGRILIIGFTSGEFAAFRSNHLLVKNYSVIGFVMGGTNPEALAKTWDELIALYVAGKIKPVISAHYPMEKVGEAMEFLASRKAIGKIVLHW